MAEYRRREMQDGFLHMELGGVTLYLMGIPTGTPEAPAAGE